MLYADYVTKLATMMATLPSNTNFGTILPACIDYAEQRMYRELDLATSSARNSNFSLTAGNRNLTPTSGTFVGIDDVNVITPAGTSSPELGTRNPLTRVSWEWLDTIYNAPGSTAVPQYWAFQDANTLAVGPWPDQSYRVEILGTIRPAPLSGTNPSTVLTLYFPDIFLAASMIFMAGYQRDFGQQSDDPSMAMSWEATYKTLMASAAAEEARKNLRAVGGSGQ